MSGFTDRENQLFDILQKFNEQGLDFVMIGGYAVSAYHHRFSVDADLVIAAETVDKSAGILESEGFEEVVNSELEVGRFVSYEKDSELPVAVDLMVGGVEVRQTGGTWSFEELAQEAESREIQGSETSVTVRVPEREVLIAMKLHSGRPTDARDVVSLAEDVDFGLVETYLGRGDKDELRASLERVLETINAEGFSDAFKGVFEEDELPEGQIERVRKFLEEQIDRLLKEN